MKQIPTPQAIIQIIALAISLFFLGCNQDVHNVKLNEIERLSIAPDDGNFAVEISIYGDVNCLVSMYLVGDGNRFKPSILLSGKVDTAFRWDWYDDTLTFELEKDPDCVISDEVKVSVKMLD